MKQSLLHYLQVVLYFALGLAIFLSAPKHTFAQNADCDSNDPRLNVPVYIYDQRQSDRYGPNGNSCINQGANISKVSGLSSTSFTCPNNGEGVSQAFIATTYRCVSGSIVFDITAPPNFSCANATWRYVGVGSGLGNYSHPDLSTPITGTGCRVTVPYPPDNWERQVIVTVNLPDPVRISHTCNNDETVTLQWNGVTGATEYGWRLNNRVNGWYNSSTDLYGYTTATSYTIPINYGTSYDWAVTATNSPGRHPAPSSWSSAFTCPAPTAGLATPTPNLACLAYDNWPNPPQQASTTLYWSWYTLTARTCELRLNSTTLPTFTSWPAGSRYQCGWTIDPSTYGLSGNFTYRARMLGGGLPDVVCENSSYCLDGQAPPSPGGNSLTCAYAGTNAGVNRYNVTYNFNSVNDLQCAGLSSTPYWAQLSNNSTFSTALNTDNTWQASPAGLTASASDIAEGTTIYAHSRARDAVDNQSAWSSTISRVLNSTNCSDVPIPTPTTPITYAITYNGNGNTGGSVPAAQTKTYGVNLTLRTNTGNLSRTGYTFAGWNTAANGTGTNYAAGGTYATNAAATMYARWTINSYTLTLTANPAAGGSFQCSTLSASSGFGACAATYTYNTTVYVRANPAANYRFTGWSGSCTGTTNPCTLVMTAARSTTATFVLMPDLVPGTITRDPPSSSSTASYVIEYCNNGPGGGGATFTIRIVNSLGQTISVTETVPPPGTCDTTTPTCSSLGDTFGGINCNEDSSIVVTLDPSNTIAETDDSNNTSAVTNFSAVASELFYKLKNASLHRLRTIDVSIPNPVALFDATDDTLEQLLIIGSAGVVTSNQNGIRILSGTGEISTNNWKKDDNNSYTETSAEWLVPTPPAKAKFVEYVVSQKKHKVITAFNQVESDTVNIFEGPGTLSITTDPDAADDNYILLVNGDVNITAAVGPAGGPIFNDTGKSIAIISTGTISVNNTVTGVNAILIANNINLGGSATPLKIKGNLITNTAINPLPRNRGDATRPNLFVVLDPQMYMDLLPLISEITLQGRQVE